MWVPQRNPFSTEDRSSEGGNITVPLLLLSVVLGGAAFSSLTYAALWQSKVRLQLRLDRCIEEVALELVEIQNTIERANLRMKVERATAAAAAVPSMGGSIKAVQPLLAIEVTLQEAERLRWTLRQARWIANRGCDRRGDLLLPLPNLRWSRPPMDSIGPQPLEWSEKSSQLTIRLWKINRFSQARISNETESSSHQNHPLTRWQAAWIRRTSLD